MIAKQTTDALSPSKRVKDTVTYFRLAKYKNLLHQLAEETFHEDNLPDVIIKPTGGRPLKYQTVRELNDAVKSFFVWCGDNLALPTVNSLSLYLGWYTELYYNYIKLDGFSQILKKAKDLMAYRLEVNAEETGNPGAMFLLKASHGYKEQADVQVNVTLNVADLYSKALRITQNDAPKLADNAAHKIAEVELIEDQSIQVDSDTQ